MIHFFLLQNQNQTHSVVYTKNLCFSTLQRNLKQEKCGHYFTKWGLTPQSHYSITEPAMWSRDWECIWGDATDYYEEENAVRYISGYIPRSHNTKAKKEKDIFLQEAINDLKGDSIELPTESEEWNGSVDRGATWIDLHNLISEATFQFLVVLKYSLRRYLKISTAYLMDHKFQITW